MVQYCLWGNPSLKGKGRTFLTHPKERDYYLTTKSLSFLPLRNSSLAVLLSASFMQNALSELFFFSFFFFSRIKEVTGLVSVAGMGLGKAALEDFWKDELGFLFFFFKWKKIFLATLYGMWDLNFPTRDWTCASCIWRVESQPLDHQGSPWAGVLNSEIWQEAKILGLSGLVFS